MKTCPNCGELVGDNVINCFNCSWNFVDPSENEKAVELEKKRREAAKRVEIQRQEYEQELKKEEEQRKAERQKKIAEYNDRYEYAVLSVMDNSDGSMNKRELSFLINNYASERWRVHSIFTNEIGRNTEISSYSGIGSGKNATINETIIVMERMILPKSKEVVIASQISGEDLEK